MNLYLRLLLLLLRFPWVTQAGVLTESRLTFHVLPTDCDINLHLTNGRYLTFMDLGRIHLMRQSRVLTYIVRNRWMPVLAGVEISYLREVPPFKKFELIIFVHQNIKYNEKIICFITYCNFYNYC